MHFDDKRNWLVAREEMDRSASYSIALQMIQSQNQKVMSLIYDNSIRVTVRVISCVKRKHLFLKLRNFQNFSEKI